MLELRPAFQVQQHLHIGTEILPHGILYALFLLNSELPSKTL
jgi:hypothetical protein